MHTQIGLGVAKQTGGDMIQMDRRCVAIRRAAKSCSKKGRSRPLFERKKTPRKLPAELREWLLKGL